MQAAPRKIKLHTQLGHDGRGMQNFAGASAQVPVALPVYKSPLKKRRADRFDIGDIDMINLDAKSKKAK